mgnify:CR=1 FL=1
MEKVEKQTPADLFVMIPRVKQITREKSETTFTLLKCANIPQFEGVLPTKEILQTHFATQRVKMEIAKRDKTEYIPQPLYLEVESSIFASIVSEARAKDKALGTPDVLALTLGSSMPCCIIAERKEEPAPKPKTVRKKRTKKIEEKHD